MIHAEPYCGSDTNIEETGLGQRPDIVLGLIEKKCKLHKQSAVTFDNLFISLPLLDKLSEDSIYGLETIRESHLQGAPLKKSEEGKWEELMIKDQMEEHRNSMAWQ